MDPRVSQINVGDIAHSLSFTYRYGGASRIGITVAEHSVRVSWECDRVNALWGLMHDAAEAYIGDCVSPVKRFMIYFKQMEERFLVEIACAFDLPDVVVPAAIEDVDYDMMIAEMAVLRGVEKPPKDVARCERMMRHLREDERWCQQYAKHMFIHRFNQLTKTGSDDAEGLG